MGLLLVGLLIGGAIGYVLGRRQAGGAEIGPDNAPPRIAAVPTVVAPPGPSKKARRLGISEVDFVPTDDILQRMQEAWEHGEELALDEGSDTGENGTDGADGTNGTTAPTRPTEPAVPVAADRTVVAAGADEAAAEEALPDPLEAERVRRVLARLQGQAPEGEPDAPAPPAPPASAEAPSTVTEALEFLAAEEYGEDLHLDGGHLACSACGTSHPTEMIEVDRVLRFEGPSDPGDEAIVLALRCPACGTKGSLVSAFGPDADPDLADAFVYLASRARHR